MIERQKIPSTGRTNFAAPCRLMSALLLFLVGVNISSIEFITEITIAFFLIGFCLLNYYRYITALRTYSQNVHDGPLKETIGIQTLDRISITLILCCIGGAFLEPATHLLINYPQLETVLIIAGLTVCVAMRYEKRSMDSLKPVVVQETIGQSPAFELTLRDTDRLLNIQAARILVYAATNYCDDAGFCTHVDLNRANARLFHTAGCLDDVSFLRWRIAVLLAGPAAEFVVHQVNSTAVIDDIEECEQLLRTMLALHTNNSTFLNPANTAEALLNQREIDHVRKKFILHMRTFILRNREALHAIRLLLEKKSVLYSDDLLDILATVDTKGLPHTTFETVSQTDTDISDSEVSQDSNTSLNESNNDDSHNLKHATIIKFPS